METDLIKQILAKGVTFAELNLNNIAIKLYMLQRDASIKKLYWTEINRSTTANGLQSYQ